jgi:uncharacterized delta-60 repeat protein
MSKVATGLAAMLMVGLAVLNAADGDLDLTFGVDGKVMTDLQGHEAGRAMAIDASGRIVVAGYTGQQTSPAGLLLARYNPDGSLDATFGTDGIVVDAGFAADSVAIDRDDSIVVVGWKQVGSNNETWVARYLPDGTRDSGFGTVGRVLTPCGKSIWSGVAIDDVGRIVMAGTSETDRLVFCLARYNHDGTPDGTFGAGGYASARFDSHAVATELAIGSGGKIAVVGVADVFNPISAQVALALFNENGSLDQGFGNSGTTVGSFGPYEAAYDVAIDAEGRIVLVGAAGLNTSQYGFLVARYLANGTMDADFNGSGWAIIDVSGYAYYSSEAVGVAIDREDGIVISGSVGDDGGVDFAVVRLNDDGSPDTSFGANGRVRTDFSGSIDYNAALAIDTDGAIVVAGTVTNPTSAPNTNRDLGLARYRARSSGYTFSGFFAPVDNAPAFNVISAGRAVPVKFSLNGNQGLDIFAAGSPASLPIACTAGASLDVVEVTLTASTSSLKYDPATDEYTYIWKTDKAWANTCRQLVLTLNDGSTHVANFQIAR